jgi:putative tryptophan/tyrosine transport system substrate-binding protein
MAFAVRCGAAMRRRDFFKMIGAGTVAWPLAARSEQSKLRAVGFLGPGYAAATPPEFTAAFLEGIAAAGFKEGRDVAIEYRWADTHLERVPALALGLVRLRTNVIFTISDVPTLIAKGATAAIPIVFITASDPVAMGLVDSLNRPGANVTGVTLIASQLGPKRIELLRELLPKAGVVSFLVNPNNANAEPNVADARMAARRLGLETNVLPASNEQELDMAFAKLGQSKPDALLVIPDPVFLNLREQFSDLEARYAIPTIHYSRENVVAGGLLSYGSSLKAMFHQAGVYVGRILGGAKPGDLPIVQPTKFELAINLKTAKALGVDVPPSLLARADEVIE